MIDVWENYEVARYLTTARPLTHSLDLGEEGLAMQATRICSLTDCDRPHFGKGFCQRHLERNRRESLKNGSAGHCAIDGCADAALSRGWCEGHYRRWLDHGDPTAGRRSPTGGPCSVDGCDRPAKARTWCKLHYYRWKRDGEVGPAQVGVTPVRLSGPQSIFWRGDVLTYTGAHSRVRAMRGPAKKYKCVDCDRPAAHWSYNHDDWDQMFEPEEEGGKPYSTKPEHYRPRCNSCHVRFDMHMRKVAGR